MGELSHAHVGEVDTAAGDADVAREHGKRVNQADGEAAVDVALETEAAPDVHGGGCGDETCQKFHGSRRLVDGVAEFGRIYLAYSGQQFLLAADFFLVITERAAPVEDLQQQYGQRRVAAGAQLDVVVGLVGGLGIDRVDDHDFGALLSGAVDGRHGMDGGPGRVHAPEDDKSGL